MSLKMNDIEQKGSKNGEFHYVRNTKITSKRVARKAQAFQVPWTRSIQHGIDIIRNPRYNKGLAFTPAERRALKLDGLLPAIVCTQDEQLARVRHNLNRQASDLDRYIYLIGLAQRNEKLFYRVLTQMSEQLMPIVYTPTVGLACQKFGHIFRRPMGMYITAAHRGRIYEVLMNWPEKHVRACVFTDGERILGLGDLGAYGMGIPIGKLMLYTACGGVEPRHCLPVTLDVGTNNEKLLNDPSYTGVKSPRLEGEAYDSLIEEFITAMKQRFGPYVLLQFEDFANKNAFRLLRKYENRCCTFNDDIQGTASVVLAGVLAAVEVQKVPLKDQRILFFGAGSAGIGIANLIALELSRQEADMTVEEARKRIFLYDSRGLIVKDRSSGGINSEKAPYAHDFPEVKKDLAETVRQLKPTAIIGVAAQPQVFTEEVCKEMCKNTERPLIFALSNPTSKAECTAEQAYTWTEGKCLFASGSPFDPVTLADGAKHVPGQGNNSYIFPGVALGVVSTGARRVTDDMFLVAARSLAKQVSAEQKAQGTLYPPLSDIRNVSAQIAADVAAEIYEKGLATMMPKPDDLLQFVRDQMYDPAYSSFVQHEWEAEDVQPLPEME